jgi:bifunctional DNase/RNase
MVNMKRRTLITGAVTVAGLAAADKVFAQPEPPNSPARVAARPGFVEATVVGIEQETSTVEGVDVITPVIVLKAKDQERYFLIWIGAAEAISITYGLEKKRLQRPLSHDLMAELVKALRGRVEAVHVSVRPNDQVIYSSLTVAGDGFATEVDSRPSDALALALRVNAPVFVVADLMQQVNLEAIKEQLNKKKGQ